MKQRRLSASGPTVSAIGLGCMGMSEAYGPSDRAESINTLHAALDAGINLFDTGDFYGFGDNEMLLAEAFAKVSRDRYVLSVKFGSLREPDGSLVGADARPAAIKNFLSYSLKRLRVDYIDVYRLTRVDPTVPIEETMGALAECVQKGWIRQIGLSEVSADTIRRAYAIHPVADVQMEYSLFSRGIEDSVLPACRDLGVSITAYGVLSRGLLSGSRPGAGKDFRAIVPRFQGENLKSNLALVDRMKSIAAERKCSVTQLAIAWVLAQGADIVPVVGARRPEQLKASLQALDLELDRKTLNAIEGAVPRDAVKGARYPEAMLSRLDSER